MDCRGVGDQVRAETSFGPNLVGLRTHLLLLRGLASRCSRLRSCKPHSGPSRNKSDHSPMSLGALTTTFTPPASCLSDLSGTSWNGTVYYLGPASTGSCFPENYEPPRSNYYSPGVCPYGYRSACSSVSGADTVVTCCPGTLTCNARTVAWASTLGCNSGWNSPDVETISPLTVIDGTSAVSVRTTVEPYGAVNAFSYQIRFQASDIQTTSSSVGDKSTSVEQKCAGC